MTRNEMDPVPKGSPDSAARRLRGTYRTALGVGILVSAALHVGAFAYLSLTFPDSDAIVSRHLEVIEFPPAEMEEPPLPAFETPERPDPVPRPAEPLLVEAAVDEDAAAPPFVPHDVPPRLENRDEIFAMLRDAYPDSLKMAGTGGTAVVWLYLTDRGQVSRLHLRASSGHPSLDRLARRVAGSMEFRPAYNRDSPVAVWVVQPIRFAVALQEPGGEGERPEEDEIAREGPPGGG